MKIRAGAGRGGLGPMPGPGRGLRRRAGRGTVGDGLPVTSAHLGMRTRQLAWRWGLGPEGRALLPRARRSDSGPGARRPGPAWPGCVPPSRTPRPNGSWSWNARAAQGGPGHPPAIFSSNMHGATLLVGERQGGVMVWVGGPRRDPGDRLGRGRRGLYLHDPPPGYQPPQPRMTAKDRQRIARRDWILEHVLTVILILSAAAVILIICLIIATHH